jgi:hypothetical protein
MMGTSDSRSVAIVSSELNMRPLDSTGVIQYKPSGEMGGKSWIWFCGTSGPLNTVSHVWANIPWCTWHAAQYSPAM